MFLKQTEKGKQQGHFKALLPTVLGLRKIRTKINIQEKNATHSSEHSNENAKRKRMNK